MWTSEILWTWTSPSCSPYDSNLEHILLLIGLNYYLYCGKTLLWSTTQYADIYTVCGDWIRLGCPSFCSIINHFYSWKLPYFFQSFWNISENVVASSYLNCATETQTQPPSLCALVLFHFYLSILFLVSRDQCSVPFSREIEVLVARNEWESAVFIFHY